MKIVHLAILLLMSQTVLAETWETNLDHSEIHFKVPYMQVSEVTGRFNQFVAQASLTEDGVIELPLSVQIEATSLDTGNKMRDGHLRGSDFFQVSEHPHIRFQASKIISLSANKFRAEGSLLIKNIAKPASIDFTTSQVVKDTWGHRSVFVKFYSSLKRKDYNMNWNKTLSGEEYLIGDVVSFSGTFQLQPLSGKTPNSKHMIPDTNHIRQRDEDRQKTESALSQKIRNLINGK